MIPPSRRSKSSATWALDSRSGRGVGVFPLPPTRGSARLVRPAPPVSVALVTLLACARSRPPTEPLPTAPFDDAAARAAARVPDPARGGPPIARGASPLPPFTGVDRATATYTGSATCAGCHKAAATSWKAQAHARALETLYRARHEFDPDCLPCHVTGYGHPGGYGSGPAANDRPGGLGAVGCEACHGPGSDHVASPTASYGALPTDASACVACHTHDTAPEFRWTTSWPQVAH